MMTREEYMLQKQEIDELMKQTRIAEKKETAAVNEDYDLRLRDLSDAYRRQRQALFEERDAKRLQIEGRYKDERRALWVKDCELVNQWRSQLNIDEITPPPLAEGSSLTRKEVRYEGFWKIIRIRCARSKG